MESNSVGHGGSHVPFGNDLRRELERFEYRRGDHVQRFRFASARIAGPDILDFGCGHGFGAVYLAGSNRFYFGIDSDAKALQWARTVVQPSFPRVEFFDSDELRSHRGSTPFDAVVLLEVLEHVTDPGALLAYCREMLRPKGRLILSTPNGYLSRGNPQLFQSRFHVREFRPDELQDTLAHAGFNGELYVQYRLDHIDSLPQIGKRALLAPKELRRSVDLSSELGPAFQRDREGRSRMSSLFQIYQLNPSWPALWRTARLESFHGSQWGFTHILVDAWLEG